MASLVESFGRAFLKARGFLGQSPKSPVATGEIFLWRFFLLAFSQ